MTHDRAACYFCSQHGHFVSLNIILEPLVIWRNKTFILAKWFGPLSHFLKGLATTQGHPTTVFCKISVQ